MGPGTQHASGVGVLVMEVHGTLGKVWGIVPSWNTWKSLGNRSMRIQDLYGGTFPGFIRNTESRWRGERNSH
jgi:hypothetical protein